MTTKKSAIMVLAYSFALLGSDLNAANAQTPEDVSHDVDMNDVTVSGTCEAPFKTSHIRTEHFDGKNIFVIQTNDIGYSSKRNSGNITVPISYYEGFDDNESFESIRSHFKDACDEILATGGHVHFKTKESDFISTNTVSYIWDTRKLSWKIQQLNPS